MHHLFVAAFYLLIIAHALKKVHRIDHFFFFLSGRDLGSAGSGHDAAVHQEGLDDQVAAGQVV